MEPAEEEFITIRELAAHWRLSVRTIRHYVGDGVLAVQRLRGRVFVSWHEVWRHEQRSMPGLRTMAARRRPLLTSHSPDLGHRLFDYVKRLRFRIFEPPEWRRVRHHLGYGHRVNFAAEDQEHIEPQPGIPNQRPCSDSRATS